MIIKGTRHIRYLNIGKYLAGSTAVGGGSRSSDKYKAFNKLMTADASNSLAALQPGTAYSSSSSAVGAGGAASQRCSEASNKH
jgi:hypothetical protein